MAGIKVKTVDKATLDMFKKRLYVPKNAEEWIERYNREIALGEKTADEILSDMKQVYQNSLAELNKEIEAFYGRYAKENGITLAEAHKRLDPGELKSAREEMRRFYEFADPERVGKDRSVAFRTELRELGARKYLSRLEEIKVRMKYILARLAAKEKSVYEKALSAEYKEAQQMAYYAIAKDVGFFVDFASPSEQIILKALEQKWVGANYSDTIWENKGKLLQALEKDFMTGLALGQNPKKIAQAMSKDFGLEYKKCERVARTEAIHIMNEVTADSYVANGIEKCQFVADLSERTCEKCGDMDGQIVDVKYRVIGVDYPPLHPACRCSTVPYYDDDLSKLFDNATRIAKDSGGKVIDVPADMTWKEWKEAYGKK